MASFSYAIHSSKHCYWLAISEVHTSHFYVVCDQPVNPKGGWQGLLKWVGQPELKQDVVIDASAA